MADQIIPNTESIYVANVAAALEILKMADALRGSDMMSSEQRASIFANLYIKIFNAVSKHEPLPVA